MLRSLAFITMRQQHYQSIHHIPFFRGMYEAIQKMTEAFFGTQSLYQSVVLVEYPRKGSHTFGFVTNRIAGKPFGSEEMYLCLFVPTVPNPTIATFTVFMVSPDAIIPADVFIRASSAPKYSEPPHFSRKNGFAPGRYVGRMRCLQPPH